MLADELALRATGPLRAVRSLSSAYRDLSVPGSRLRRGAKALQELAGLAVRPAAETPLNERVSSHRRVSGTSMSMEAVKAIRKEAGCTINDVVLAIAAGAFREYMIHRGVNPERLDFRVSAPVAVRGKDDKGKLGNHVSSWIVRMPIAEPDPWERLAAIRDQTHHLKESQQALAVEKILEMEEWTPKSLLSLGARLNSEPINSIVTNIPGPTVPLYRFGARLVESYPVVPLLNNMGLTIALFSYDGKLFWGFNADYFMVPDLEIFVGMVQRSFEAFRVSPGDETIGRGLHLRVQSSQ